jgi:hypothetical protein
MEFLLFFSSAKMGVIDFPQSAAISVDTAAVRITHGNVIHVFYHNLPRLYKVEYNYSARMFQFTLMGVNQEVSI